MNHKQRDLYAQIIKSLEKRAKVTLYPSIGGNVGSVGLQIEVSHGSWSTKRVVPWKLIDGVRDVVSELEYRALVWAESA